METGAVESLLRRQQVSQPPGRLKQVKSLSADFRHVTHPVIK